MNCPQCESRIELRQVRYPRFECLTCGSELYIPTGFQLKTLTLGAAVAFWGAHFIGFKGSTLVVWGTLAAFPIGGLVEIVALLVMPHSIERYIRPGSLGLK